MSQQYSSTESAALERYSMKRNECELRDSDEGRESHTYRGWTKKRKN
jgi:hypothetical protein